MADTTTQSERIIGEAKRSLAVQRDGGFHRRSQSIGRGSRQLKTRHLLGKVKRMVLAIAGIVFAAMIAGLIIGGIGFTGVMVTIMAIVAAIFVLGNYPRMKVPQRGELNRGDVKQLVGRTELWLESQRPALPPPAADLVGQIGGQLDALGLQLQGLDQNHPAAREVRALVGDTLPEMVDSYRKIPAHLRREKRAGSTPDEQLTEGLGKISSEIDSVTRQLAEGSLDDLAVRTRYLEYKYGGAEAAEKEI